MNNVNVNSGDNNIQLNTENLNPLIFMIETTINC